ncbi:hypothetical protein A4U88_0670 [Serratia marcescens]|nr:hypothetical protein A4U88_0670 [Serratia marcescens]AXK25924.1 Hypothetical protein SmN45_4196 [Serratia marcescens]
MFSFAPDGLAVIPSHGCCSPSLPTLPAMISRLICADAAALTRRNI